MLLGDPRSPTACPFRRAPRSGHPTTSVSTRSACPFRRAPRSGHPTTSVSTRSACLFRRAPRSGHPTASVSTRSACPFSHRCPHAAPCSMSCRRPALNPARSCPPATVGVPHSPVPLPLPGIRESPAGDVHIRHGPRLIRPCRYLFREPPAGDLPTRRGPGPIHPLRAGPCSGQRESPARDLPIRRAPGPIHPLRAGPCSGQRESPARDLPTHYSRSVSLTRAATSSDIWSLPQGTCSPAAVSASRSAAPCRRLCGPSSGAGATGSPPRSADLFHTPRRHLLQALENREHGAAHS